MKYGFIGCGNMGSALAKGLAKVTGDIMVSDFLKEKAASLAESLGCRIGDNTQIAAECERIFLGVKPQMMREMLDGIRVGLTIKKPLLISMAAGLEISTIENFVGKDVPIIRIMPNTPVSVGKGMIPYCRNALVDDNTLADFLYDMRYCGIMDAIDEKLIDAACAVSGCGPAYMYMFIEALADGAVACGLPREKALKYAAATMSGAAELALTSNAHVGELKDAVCSPAGSTIMGVKALEEGGIRAAAINAVKAAFERNRELGKS